MDFELSKEQETFKDTIRGFAEKEISPLVNEAEVEEKYPVQLFPRLGSLGYLCPRYPKEYGGGGLGKIGDCISIIEIARICAGISAGITTQSGIGTSALFGHGTEEQKRKYLIPAIKGEKIASFALTEPDAGSDAAAMKSTATRTDSGYILNGTKMFITNGPIADFVLVAAYTDKNLGARGGVSLFIVDRGSPGFTVRKLHKMCFRSAEHGELVFKDFSVPKSNVVGEEGKGFEYLMETLGGGRISHAARTLGIAQAAYESAYMYAQKRVQFGQPIAKFQAISFKLARMALEIDAAKWLVFHAAWLHDQGREHIKEAAMAKLFSSEVSMRATNCAMQIHGGYGFIADSLVGRYFRDSRLGTITEGTSEIQLGIIARRIGLR